MQRRFNQPDYADLSDTDLAGRLRADDERAFETLFFRYYKHLTAIGQHFLKDSSLTQDAIQDIYLKLWNNRHTLHEAESLKAFLAISMKNHVLNLLRQQQRTVFTADYTDDARPTTETPAQTLQSQEYADILERGIRQLTPKQEEVFRLRIFGGLDNEQVARQMGVSINTVKSHYTSALQAVRAYVSQHAQIELMLALGCLFMEF
jgi:RNA polymerase sigma-70 factor (family 1)